MRRQRPNAAWIFELSLTHRRASYRARPTFSPEPALCYNFAVRKRAETSKEVFGLRNCPGRWVPLLHAARRGQVKGGGLRKKPPRRPGRSVCDGHATTAPRAALRARARPAFFQRHGNTRRSGFARPPVRTGFCHRLWRLSCAPRVSVPPNTHDTGARPMDELKKLIREVPDYPKPGILFYDLTTLLKDKRGFHTLIDRLCEHYNGHTIDLVAGIEARGFIFAPALA